MNYFVHINEYQELVLRKMLEDTSYWAGGHPPHSPSQLIKWTVENAIDDYETGKKSGRIGTNTNR